MRDISRHKRFTIALLVAGGAISLMACDSAQKPSETDDEKLISRTVVDMEALQSENGEKTQLMRAPLVEEHAFAKDPFEEYPKGIEAIRYDSLGNPSMRIVADHALRWINLDLWQLTGNVFAVGDEGKRKYYTQQLYWNVKTKKIWSNVDSKIEDDGNIYYPERFEALDDFSFWEFDGFSGTMNVALEPSADSTAAAPPPTQPATDTGQNAPSSAEVTEPASATTTSPTPSASVTVARPPSVPRTKRMRPAPDSLPLKP